MRLKLRWVSPTRAGVVGGGCTRGAVCYGFAHTRGGGWVDDMSEKREQAFHPHARGWLATGLSGEALAFALGHELINEKEN